MHTNLTTTEVFLIAIAIIFSVPYLIWRVLRTDYYAPLVVVQIITGIVLGPGILGRIFPDYYAFIFTKPVVQSLNALFEKSPADERVESFAHLLYDQAVIAEGSKIQDVTGFAKRLNDLLVRTVG